VGDEVESALLRSKQWQMTTLGSRILREPRVALGVFLGMQASNWNEALHDAERGHEYIARIGNDLEADIEGLSRRETFRASVMTYGKAALEYAESGTLRDGSAWKTLLAYYQASQVWPYRPTGPTYQEMLAAGDLGLIRDTALRSALARYYVAGVRPLDRIFDIAPLYRERVRGLTPFAIQEAIWGTCARSSSVDEFDMIDCPPPVSEEQAFAVIERLRADTALTEQLRFWITNVRVMNEFAKHDADSARELATSLKAIH
jgi:hypothetical protein